MGAIKIYSWVFSIYIFHIWQVTMKSTKIQNLTILHSMHSYMRMYVSINVHVLWCTQHVYIHVIIIC